MPVLAALGLLALTLGGMPPTAGEPDDEAADQVALPPEPVGPLNLEQAVLQATLKSPQLEVFSWDVRTGDARVRQAGARNNPELEVRHYQLGIPRSSTEPDAGRTRVVIEQPITIGK